MKKEATEQVICNSSPSQCKRLVKYLREHKEGISSAEALQKLGIGRLASRIHELSKQGFDFDRTRVPFTNQWGSGKYTVYTLKEE